MLTYKICVGKTLTRVISGLHFFFIKKGEKKPTSIIKSLLGASVPLGAQLHMASTLVGHMASTPVGHMASTLVGHMASTLVGHMASTLVGHMASTNEETAADSFHKSTLVAEGYGQRDVHEVGSFTQGLADIQLP